MMPSSTKWPEIMLMASGGPAISLGGRDEMKAVDSFQKERNFAQGARA